MARILFHFFLVLLPAFPAMADTAAGIAALDRGDYAAALKELKAAAENGDPTAQAKYGLMLVKGLGVEQDIPAAVEWFRKSAEQGNAEGQYMLGSAYDRGDTGSVDLVRAAELYRKAAEQGLAKAQFNLGHMLVNGAGVARQPGEGAVWVGKAAEQNWVPAVAMYGELFMRGIGVEQNLLSARYWLQKAVGLGSPDAPANLNKVEKTISLAEAGGVPRTAGGDGTSTDRAINFPDVKSEFAGVAAEHAVVKLYFQEWQWLSQALINNAGEGVFDEIELVASDGTSRKIYFDISNWFGKIE